MEAEGVEVAEEEDNDEDVVATLLLLLFQAIAAGGALALEMLESAARKEEPVRPRKKRKTDLERDWQLSPFARHYYLNPPGHADGQPHPADPGQPLGTRFRLNFRMDRPSALRLIQRVEEEGWAPSFGKPKVTGKAGAPVGLLVLCALNALGRGTVFRQFEDLAGVSGETVNKFFHVFCKEAAKRLYPEYVRLPSSQEEFLASSAEFAVAGLDGCVGCTDGVQLQLWKCAANLANQMTGKEGYPTLGFNVTVNFRRRILHSTGGIPGRLNDKTKTNHDELLQTLLRGDNLNFAWARCTSQGTQQAMKGAYVVVDGGYQSYWCLVAPKKEAVDREETVFSEWLESVRKCVECTFGILKIRFTVLNHLRTHRVQSVEDIMFTCMALHNMLLEYDGLDEPYNAHVPLDHTMRIVQRMFAARTPETELETEASVEESNDAHGNEAEPSGDDSEEGMVEVGSSLVINAGGEPSSSSASTNELLDGRDGEEVPRETAALFRSRLLAHWTWKLSKGQVKWPSRTGNVERV